MYYCQNCRMVYETEQCLECGEKLRLVKDDDPCFLVFKQVPLADMIRETLESHHIPYFDEPVMGAGLALKVGPMLEKYRFYVPYSSYDEAKKLIHVE